MTQQQQQYLYYYCHYDYCCRLLLFQAARAVACPWPPHVTLCPQTTRTSKRGPTSDRDDDMIFIFPVEINVVRYAAHSLPQQQQYKYLQTNTSCCSCSLPGTHLCMYRAGDPCHLHSTTAGNMMKFGYYLVASNMSSTQMVFKFTDIGVTLL